MSQTYMNDAFYKMLGVERASRRHYFGENTLSAAHPDDLANIQRALAELTAGKQSVRVVYRVRMEGGRWFWLSLSAAVVVRQPGYFKIYAAFSDCNEIKRAQQELEANRRTLENALRSAKVMTWRFDCRNARITDSLTLGEQYGLPKVIENVPQSIIDSGLIAQESIDSLRRLCAAAAEERVATADTRVCGKNGVKSRWYKQIYTPVFDEAGRYVDCIAIAIDITEQKEREQHYEERLRLSRAAAQDAVATAGYNLTRNTVTEFESRCPALNAVDSCDSADAVLKSIGEVICGEDERAAFARIGSTEALIRSFRSGRPHFELRHRLKGDGRWLQTTFDMLSNPYTGDIEAIGVLRDITDAVRAESVVNRLLRIDYQSILLIDLKDGSVMPFRQEKEDDCLKKILELQKTSKNSADALQQFLSRYAVPGTAARAIRENSMECIREKLAHTLFYECMYTLVLDGKKKQFRVLYSYLGDDKTLLLSAVQDTTALYEQEEKQKAELAQALAEAETANRAKTDFMSRMSHDMRTPMNAILGLSALTLDDAKNPEAVRENMGKMRQAGDFMLGLVNDILDMARIEDGSVVLHMEPYTYSDFLRNMKTMFLPQCEAKGIRIRFVEPLHIDPTGLTDKIRINQIFFNIFSNAVKYTPTGGSIECSVQNVKKDEKRISGEYVIRDTGIGMTKEFQKKLFHPFMQEDGSVTPELQGSGLGLSITKQLVERMGGTIRIESEKGKGTTVIVGLSFELVQSPTKNARQAARNDEGVLMGRHILLAEDHPLNAQIARRLLEKKGMVVTYAENGRIAVEKFGASEIGGFDAILMDIRMPEMSGFEASRSIRALKRADAQRIPILAMSANAYPEDIQKGLDSGMNDYLTKPVEPEKLYTVLMKYL